MPVSSRFDLALSRRLLGAGCALRFNVCRCGRGALRRGTTLACFGLQFRFALWFSVNCWMYARDERVEPTQGLTQMFKIYSTDWTRDIRVMC